MQTQTLKSLYAILVPLVIAMLVLGPLAYAGITGATVPIYVFYITFSLTIVVVVFDIYMLHRRAKWIEKDKP